MEASGVRIQHLYQGYRGKVFRRARQLLRDEAAAEDATQEVFLRLLDTGDCLLQHPEPIAWLYRVTTNLCLNRLRDEDRRVKLVARNPPRNDVHAGDSEARAVVKEILGTISAELQQIAVHYHAEGMTCEEIADEMGVSRRTIGNRLVTLQALALDRLGNA